MLVSSLEPESGKNRSLTILARLPADRDALSDSENSVNDDHGLAPSTGDAFVSVGDNVGVVSISTASMCEVDPLDIESIDLIEAAVLRRSKCRFTSILLLKYASKQSSRVRDDPSVGSGGMATSRSRSLMNLWSSLSSSFPVW